MFGLVAQTHGAGKSGVLERVYGGGTGLADTLSPLSSVRPASEGDSETSAAQAAKNAGVRIGALKVMKFLLAGVMESPSPRS